MPYSIAFVKLVKALNITPTLYHDDVVVSDDYRRLRSQYRFCVERHPAHQERCLHILDEIDILLRKERVIKRRAYTSGNVSL